MVAAIQGKEPRRIHVELGDGSRASFRLADFSKLLGSATGRFQRFVEGGATGSVAEPCAACTLCPWRDHCGSQWEAEDHLSLIAGMSRPQAQKLRDAGIATIASIAALPDEARVPRVAPAPVAKPHRPAALQLARRSGRAPVAEPLLPAEARK